MTEALTSLMASYGGLILMKSTFLLGFVYLASLALRQSSASTQHYLWTLAFVALVTLPVVSYLSMANGSWRIDAPAPRRLAAIPQRSAPRGRRSRECRIRRALPGA